MYYQYGGGDPRAEELYKGFHFGRIKVRLQFSQFRPLVLFKINFSHLSGVSSPQSVNHQFCIVTKLSSGPSTDLVDDADDEGGESGRSIQCTAVGTYHEVL